MAISFHEWPSGRAAITWSTTSPPAGSVGRVDATNRVVAGWILEERLGSGGFGEVWKARRRHGELFRALKIVPVSSEKTFASWRHEISRLEELSHPNIVRFYDADIVGDGGPYDDFAWIATELCERSLADELQRRPEPTLAPAEASQLVEAMLGALAAAHASGCVHRDIKPANILVHRSGTWKLCDFGTARLVPDGESHPRTAVVGTFPYMSPAAHRGHQDAAADLYALGVTLHEALCGRRLHVRTDDMTDPQYVMSIMETPPVISPDLDPRWQHLVAALIGADGPHTAAELLGRLRHDGDAAIPVLALEPTWPEGQLPAVPGGSTAGAAGGTGPAAGAASGGPAPGSTDDTVETPVARNPPTRRLPRKPEPSRGSPTSSGARPRATVEARGDSVHLWAIVLLIAVSLGTAGLLLHSLIPNPLILGAILGGTVLVLLLILVVS